MTLYELIDLFRSINEDVLNIYFENGTLKVSDVAWKRVSLYHTLPDIAEVITETEWGEKEIDVKIKLLKYSNQISIDLNTVNSKSKQEFIINCFDPVNNGTIKVKKEK